MEGIYKIPGPIQGRNIEIDRTSDVNLDIPKEATSLNVEKIKDNKYRITFYDAHGGVITTRGVKSKLSSFDFLGRLERTLSLEDW